MDEFAKHPGLIVRGEDPFNAGPPPELLGRTFLTPVKLFFVRNHGKVPRVDASRYRLSVDGLVRRPLRLTLDDLRERFPQTTFTATLQCAGNRRRELIAVRPIPGELEWDTEAIGTAVWGGVALREVLLAAEVEGGARHVAFLGLDEVEKGGQVFGFGGSIPLEKATSPEVILALEMNGAPLPPVHGYPLRVVVPGYIGARSVKWLASITVQVEPSTNYFQARAYKIFPPQVAAAEADWERGLALGEFPVNAAILHPRDGDRLSAGAAAIQGYAISGGRRIERVDLSLDRGRTWVTADLSAEGTPWTWRLWKVRLDLAPGGCEIVVRAWDTAAQTQPEEAAKIWNFKGYVNNAWHRVRVRVT